MLEKTLRVYEGYPYYRIAGYVKLKGVCKTCGKDFFRSKTVCKSMVSAFQVKKVHDELSEKMNEWGLTISGHKHCSDVKNVCS